MIIDKEGKFRHRRIAGAVGGRAGGRVVDVRGGDGLRLAGGSQGEGIAEGDVAAALGELHEEGLGGAVYPDRFVAFVAVVYEACFALQDEPPGAIAEAHGDECVRDGDVALVRLQGCGGELVFVGFEGGGGEQPPPI